MSRKTVQLLIGRLLTDEEYRLQFLDEPRRFLDALRSDGRELSEGEVAALLRIDAVFWSEAASRIDPDLQRSSLRAD